MNIINHSRSTEIASNGKMADSFMSRMVGLLNRSSLNEGEALVITQCKSIHMLFMKFPIDAIFVDHNDHVVGLLREIKPFRFSRIFMNASYVIELPVGAIDLSKTTLGDHIKISRQA